MPLQPRTQGLKHRTERGPAAWVEGAAWSGPVSRAGGRSGGKAEAFPEGSRWGGETRALLRSGLIDLTLITAL